MERDTMVESEYKLKRLAIVLTIHSPKISQASGVSFSSKDDSAMYNTAKLTLFLVIAFGSVFSLPYGNLGDMSESIVQPDDDGTGSDQPPYSQNSPQYSQSQPAIIGSAPGTNYNGGDSYDQQGSDYGGYAPRLIGSYGDRCGIENYHQRYRKNICKSPYVIRSHGYYYVANNPYVFVHCGAGYIAYCKDCALGTQWRQDLPNCA